MHDDKTDHAHEAATQSGGAHEHTHTHTHEHAHTHPHEHSHDGGHSHMADKIDGGASGMSKSKLKALLSYMKDHNREHAKELHGLLDAIKELDADEILDLIENGAKSIEEAAEQIEQALEVLEEL
ncbi:MAG: hypothetical protein LBL54_02145 [Clostridiales Family XIII bacterium]|jgi:beta-phosphoglucomutase-like phosphatase (HAD superfamily)|nr:hypothetical protein [Clostridiales Family XIII bacterium]